MAHRTTHDDEARIRMNIKRQLRYITEFLEMFFAWPKEDKPDNVNFKLLLKAMLFTSTLILSVLLTVFHMYHFRSVSLFELTEDFVTVLHIVCAAPMVFVYSIYLKGTVRFFELLPQVYHWQAFLNKERINYKKWTRVYKSIFLLSAVTIMLQLEFDYDNCEKRKIKNNSIRSCGVLLPYYLPFDFEAFPIRHCILIYQGICIVICFLVLDHIFFIPIFYIDKTICLMDYMIYLVTDLNTSILIEDEKQMNECLRQIIDVHQVIRRFNKWFNKLSRYLQMLLYVSGRLVMAVLIFHTIMVGFDEYFAYALVWAGGISLFQIGSQLLINKSMEIETALYNVKWYKIKKIKDRRSYHLLYLMTQKPIILEAGPDLCLSFSLLLQACKEIYSFTAMLIKISRKQT